MIKIIEILKFHKFLVGMHIHVLLHKEMVDCMYVVVMMVEDYLLL